MKKKWGVVRTAVLLKSKIGPKVSAEDDKCPSSSKSLVYPYPTKFAKPNGYPTKFDKPQPYPTAFIKPNQIQMETQTMEATFMSKWENAIHQLIVKTNQSKGPVSYETESTSESKPKDEGTLSFEAEREATSPEPAVTARNRWGKVAHQLVNENKRRKRSSVAPATSPQSVSYSPSLPAPEGPFPPPAFTYNSPAHQPKITSEPENGSAPENVPEPAYSRWNNIIRQLSNAKKSEGVTVSEAVSNTPLPPPPPAPPLITCTSPEGGAKPLSIPKVKTA